MGLSHFRLDNAKGFIVRVNKSGKLVFMCEYARAKRVMIGKVGVLSLASARDQAKTILADAVRGVAPKQRIGATKSSKEEDNKPLTLREFIDHIYSPWFKLTHPGTWGVTMQDIKKNFLSDFGDLLLEEISRPMVEKWRIKRSEMYRIRIKGGKQVKEKIRPSTVNRNIEIFSAILNRAVEFGKLKDNPLKGMKKLKVPNAERIRFLSKDEYQRLIDALDQREHELREARERYNQWRSDRHLEPYSDLNEQAFVDHIKPMVLLVLGSGIRQGALMRLRWELDFGLIIQPPCPSRQFKKIY
ncbi:MAG: integrase arm-type DNA-binding domain-containing protein [Gammaproteobacteria bacterium]|nr:integrase arm-type DNA-binding domain-containing protein [Gammaproteobacteria bacterium]